MNTHHVLLICYLAILSACTNTAQKEKEVNPNQFSVKNTIDAPRKDALVEIEASDLTTQFPAVKGASIKFTEKDKNIPFQAIDKDGDGQADEYALLLDFEAGEEKTILVTTLAEGEAAPEFKKRTQAEISHKINGEWKEREYMNGEFQNVDFLRVPPEHTDHSWFIRYEGPGWESDLVGYRFYLDWRNATDIFGKKTTDMVLQDVGQDGFDSYHEPSDWGMDVLKVGSSLGVGALGTWLGDKALRVETTDSLTCEIVENGVVESKIRTNYYGWKVGDVSTDVISELSIHAGSRLTRHDVSLSEALPNLCTGIVKHESGELFKYENGSWGYIATWGKQSLADDYLGMAVFYKNSEAQEVTEDEHSHVVVLSPTNNQLTYYFTACWEQEPNGIHTLEAFKKYLDSTLMELGTPLFAKYEEQ